LIDDDNDFRTALAANLRDDRYRVLDIRTPEDLPTPARLRQVRLLITCDHNAQSVTFCDRFHLRHPAIPIIVMTAFRTDLLDRAAASRPYMTVVSKPLDYDELNKIIAARLAS
jgi:DNA-binding NtrC family response regulator